MWIFFSVSALAQNDVGSIVGFVTDSSGAVVPNAKVTVKNEGTGESRTVSTDGSGHYAVPNLAPTSYTMTAEATGFQKFESTHNVLASNSTISIDAKLTLGAATQTVEVTRHRCALTNPIRSGTERDHRTADSKAGIQRPQSDLYDAVSSRRR